MYIGQCVYVQIVSMDVCVYGVFVWECVYVWIGMCRVCRYVCVLASLSACMSVSVQC